MIYSIELTFDAEQDIERYKKSGDKKILIKIGHYPEKCVNIKI